MSKLKYPTPQLLLKAICNAIRAKTGSNDKIAHQDIPDELDNILTEEEYEIAARELSNIIYGSEVKVLDSKYIPYIASYKFFGSGLITIDLPKCTSIGDNAFASCTSLTTIDLPKCSSIGEYAFQGCTRLTTIDLPECTSIINSAFENCTNLTTINLPECTSIGEYAFGQCTNLTTVNLPKCTFINYYAFENCTNLTTIILSNNQVVTLKNINAFTNTPIKNGTGYIYVPDNVLNEYKTNNPDYQFKPISELPSNLKEEYGYD